MARSPLGQLLSPCRSPLFIALKQLSTNCNFVLWHLSSGDTSPPVFGIILEDGEEPTQQDFIGIREHNPKELPPQTQLYNFIYFFFEG